MWIIGLLLLVVAVCGLTVRYVDSRRQIVLVAASLAPLLMAASLPATVLLFSSSAALGVGGLVVTAACAATRLPPRRRRASGGVDLTVMQANILLGGSDKAEMVAAVDRLGVDVLTVVELTTSAVDELVDAGIEERLPYRFARPRPGGQGTGIWSRYPLVDETRHDGFVTELLSATIEVPNSLDTRIVAVHPVPPWPRHPSAWFRELGLLRELLVPMAEGGEPVIVSGDFNATRDHKRYRDLLGSRFDDTASRSLRTYAADRWYPPIIGIDHIVVSGAAATDAGTVALPGSDHRGVWARISVPSS